MDSNAICLFSVAVLWLFSVRRVFQGVRLGQAGWVVVYAALLAVFLSGLAYFPGAAGHVSAAAYAVLVLAPTLTARRIQRFTAQQQYAAAVPWAWLLCALHPSGGYRALPALLRALGQAHRGEFAAAEAALTTLTQSATKSIAGQAQLHLFRIRADWSGYLEATRALTEQHLHDDSAMLSGRLRALGETGALDQMVAIFTRARASLESTPQRQQRAYAQLFVSAFTGRTVTLERLFRGPLRDMDTPTQRFWRATAAHALGHEEQARVEFEALVNGPNESLAHAARLRLALPPARVEGALSEASLQSLAELEREVVHVERYEAATSIRSARVCVALIALNLLAFGYEIELGGSEQAAALYEAGALVTGELSVHESYRLLSALFLHFGWLHLSMNMLNLLAIGPFVEVTLGAARMLVVYLASGLLGALVVAVRPTLEPGLFLGASGCIMGLLGATAAILLHAHRRERARPAQRRLWRIVLVLAVQLAFDLSIPGISLTAHWVGAAVGFTLCYLSLVSLARADAEPLPPPPSARTPA